MPFNLGQSLTAKMGPLPVWAWGAIAGIGGYVAIKYLHVFGLGAPPNAAQQAQQGATPGQPLGMGGMGGNQGGPDLSGITQALQQIASNLPNPQTITQPPAVTPQAWSNIQQTPQDIMSQLQAGSQWTQSPVYAAQLAVQNGTATLQQLALLQQVQEQLAAAQASGWLGSPLQAEQAAEQLQGAQWAAGQAVGGSAAGIAGNPIAGTSGGLATQAPPGNPIGAGFPPAHTGIGGNPIAGTSGGLATTMAPQSLQQMAQMQGGPTLGAGWGRPNPNAQPYGTLANAVSAPLAGGWGGGMVPATVGGGGYR